MILSKEYETTFDVLNEHCKDILSKLLPYFTEVSQKRLVPADTQAWTKSDDKFVMLAEGTLRCQEDERILFHYEAPEFVGIELGIQSKNYTVKGDFAVHIFEVDRLIWLKKVGANHELLSLWISYYESRLALFSFLFASSVQPELHAPPEVLHAEAGKILIRQGEVGDKVFTLLEGSCLVQVDGVTVGEVKADEIFGALAVVGETTRTATVVAEKPVVYLSVPKDKFMELMQYRPTTVLKLIQDMTRALVALNSKVVAKLGPLT